MRTPRELYDCLGCPMQCGRCAHSMRMIIQEALASSKAAFPPSG
jgi:bacterioferritin-associated ferredoxin